MLLVERVGVKCGSCGGVVGMTSEGCGACEGRSCIALCW